MVAAPAILRREPPARARDLRDPPVAEVEQVPHRLVGARRVRGRHRWDAIVERHQRIHDHEVIAERFGTVHHELVSGEWVVQEFTFEGTHTGPLQTPMGEVPATGRSLKGRGVQVFKLVTKNTIEEQIHALIERKKGLLEEVIGAEEADQITYLSRDELIAVFETMMKES